MAKMLRSKKGISPILATLLLIVIAVAAIIVTYAWVMTFTSSQTGKVGQFITVANMVWSNSSITVDLQNSGTEDAKILKVYLGTSESSRTELTSVSYDPTTQIVSKDGGIITITITTPWTSGQRYYFRFLTEAQPWDYDERAP
jgi:flagellin-like protein